MNHSEPAGRSLDAVVGDLYDAAAGFGDWRRACDRIAAALDLIVVQMLGVDRRSGAAIFSFEGGSIPPESALEYLLRYHAVNPRIPLGLALGPGEWLHDHEHFDDDFVAREPFFAEFLVPYGGRWMSATKLIEDDEVVVFLGLHRGVHARPLDAREIAELEAIRPHLVRAVRILLGRRGLADAARMGAALLDLMPQATIVVDEARRIVHENAAGAAMLESGEVVHRRGAFLLARHPRDETSLVEALRALVLSGTVSPSPPRERAAARLRGARAGSETLAVAVAVRPEATMRVFGERPLAILLLHPLAAPSRVDRLTVGLAFDPTPAEADVAASLADGLGPEAIAAARGVSPNTVRSQLRSLYGKLGAARQADVVRLVAGLPRLGD